MRAGKVPNDGTRQTDAGGARCDNGVWCVASVGYVSRTCPDTRSFAARPTSAWIRWWRRVSPISLAAGLVS